MPYPTSDKRAKKRDGLIPNPKAKLFDQMREVMRFHHYSYRTEKTDAQWVRRHLAFHRRADRSGRDSGWRHPRSLGAPEVAAFLSHLAMAGRRPALRVGEAAASITRVMTVPAGSGYLRRALEGGRDDFHVAPF